ncbi:hypothetical protein D3C83_236410 [compost metagenome]
MGCRGRRRFAQAVAGFIGIQEARGLCRAKGPERVSEAVSQGDTPLDAIFNDGGSQRESAATNECE